jgi:hypothetical protein
MKSMTVNELRVDNYIIYKTPFGKKEERIGQMKRGDFSSYDERLYHPIPLTPEWLERCGFEKQKSNTAGIELYRLGGIIIEHEVEAEKYNSAPYALAYDQDGLIVYPLSYHPEFVHQLQNFYFALTGEELQIKMP